MQRNLLIKTLAVGIIVVLVGVSVISSAVDINSDKSKESIENPEVELVDSYNAIITYIEGSCCDFIVNKGLIIRDVDILACDDQTSVDIQGFRYTPSGHIVGFVIYDIKNVFAHRFIGYAVHTHVQYKAVRGINFGKIWWS